MDKYGVSSSIESGSGIVALDISGFNEGSSIYITVDSYNDKYTNRMNYNFSKDVPNYDSFNLLQDYKFTYSDGTTSYKHNVSDGHGGFKIY